MVLSYHGARTYQSKPPESGADGLNAPNIVVDGKNAR